MNRRCRSEPTVLLFPPRFRSAVPPGLAAVRRGWPEWIVLALYTGLVGFAIPHHEPWADEAQAWQLARTLSLHDLFRTYLGYEGAPGLWHFLLWIMSRAGVGYSGLHWFSGAIAVAGVSLLIFCSPLPRYLRLVLPFTYFLLYQYAVIARNYVLAPILLFAIAALWKRRPMVLALLLGLLANVALHCAVISGGLAIVYLVAQGRTGWRERRREMVGAAAILFCSYALAIWSAWPPHDLPMPVHVHTPLVIVAISILAASFGICEPWGLAFPFWIAIAACFRARRSSFYLLPVGFFIVFSGAVYVAFWHAGLLTPLLICLLWITWPAAGKAVGKAELAGRVGLLLVACIQILWSGYALVYDYGHAYSPDRAAAEFLAPLVQQGAEVAVTYVPDAHDVTDRNGAFFSVGLLPYFDHNIYVNHPAPFWLWSSRRPTEKLFAAALQAHPRIVLVEVMPRRSDKVNPFGAPKIQQVERAGYHLTNMFCGGWPQRFGMADERHCHLIFQPLPKPASGE